MATAKRFVVAAVLSGAVIGSMAGAAQAFGGRGTGYGPPPPPAPIGVPVSPAVGMSPPSVLAPGSGVPVTS